MKITIIGPVHHNGETLAVGATPDIKKADALALIDAGAAIVYVEPEKGTPSAPPAPVAPQVIPEQNGLPLESVEVPLRSPEQFNTIKASPSQGVPVAEIPLSMELAD